MQHPRNMAAEIPLKIRVDIRDLWDSPTSNVQLSANSLSRLLGCKLIAKIDWLESWNELKGRFPDQVAFIPNISRFAVTWCERLLWRLENDSFTGWKNQLLLLLSQPSSISDITLQLKPSVQVIPRTTWNSAERTFTLEIPKSDTAPQSRLVSSLDQDFDALVSSTATISSAQEDDRTEYASETPKPNLTQEEKPGGPLPKLDAISRPQELFTASSPYILIVDNVNNILTVQSSHEPSLELLFAYFKKWGRTITNNGNVQPALKFELVESSFCYVMDTLVIEPPLIQRGVGVSPVLVLAFIEGVLGYKMLHTTGSRWVYRLERELN